MEIKTDKASEDYGSVVAELLRLTAEGCIKWSAAAPLSNFESRRVVNISDKLYEERTPVEQSWGGTELTIIWAAPTNYNGMSIDTIQHWAKVKQIPVGFILDTPWYVGRIAYDIGMQLMHGTHVSIERQYTEERRKEKAMDGETYPRVIDDVPEGYELFRYIECKMYITPTRSSTEFGVVYKLRLETADGDEDPQEFTSAVELTDALRAYLTHMESILQKLIIARQEREANG